MTGIIVASVAIAVIASLGVVAARQRRTVGSESAHQWKIERDAIHDANVRGAESGLSRGGTGGHGTAP